MDLKIFIRTTGERKLDKSIVRELNGNYTLLVDKEHKPIESFINQLRIISDYDAILLEDDVILCKDFLKEATKVIEIFCEEFGFKLLNGKNDGCLFSAAADIIRSSLGEKEADAFLAVAASGSLEKDLDKETVRFEPCSDLAIKKYDEIKNGRLLLMDVYMTDKVLEWTDYEEAEIQEECEHYKSPLENDGRCPYPAKKAARIWEKIRKKQEFRALVGEIGETRTGDKKIDSLIAIVREIVEWEEFGE